MAGKAVQKGDKPDWTLKYAGDCQRPLSIAQNDTTRVFAHYQVRCRKCGPCLRARTNYWGYAAMEQTKLCEASGGRTWFGTLTLRPDAQGYVAQLAYQRWAMSHGQTSQPEWWLDPKCDERFRLVRDELLKEVQKFWKRLRKAGHRFKYFLVFERHASGLPHMHFLLHEQGQPIRKRQIQNEWPWGHSNVSIVGGKSARAAAPEKAAWYVVKYLSKSVQARQIASRLYRPEKRAGR